MKVNPVAMVDRVVRAAIAFTDEETPATRSELVRAVLDLKTATRRQREEWLVDAYGTEPIIPGIPHLPGIGRSTKP